MTTLKTSVWQTTDDATYFQFGHCPWQLHNKCKFTFLIHNLQNTYSLGPRGGGGGGGGGGAFGSFDGNLNRPALKSSILPQAEDMT